VRRIKVSRTYLEDVYRARLPNVGEQGPASFAASPSLNPGACLATLSLVVDLPLRHFAFSPAIPRDQGYTLNHDSCVFASDISIN
jgi:hypothetical protein